MRHRRRSGTRSGGYRSGAAMGSGKWPSSRPTVAWHIRGTGVGKYNVPDLVLGEGRGVANHTSTCV